MKKIITFLLAIAIITHSAAQDAKLMAMKNKIDGGYNFWLYTPKDYNPEIDKKPVIVFLHGASLCGTDLDKIKTYGTIDALLRGRPIDALVIAPQNPKGSWVPSKIMDVVNWVTSRYSCDENRISAIGMSLGGYGTMDFVGTYYNKLAAAMALCGGCTLKDQSGLAKLPFWIMHGDADPAVNISESKNVAEKINKENGKLLKTYWIEGGNHGTPARVLYLAKTYEWLLSHNLTDRTLNTKIDITKTDFNYAYKNLDKINNPITIINNPTNKDIPNIHKKDVVDNTKQIDKIETKNDTKTGKAQTAAEQEEVKNKTEEMSNAEISQPKTDSYKYYTVKKGDTLKKISKATGVSIEKICNYNGIKETTILRIGKTLKLPLSAQIAE